MTDYLNNSKFFNWVRSKVFGIDKPYALGWDEWTEWDDNTKKSQPVAWFFTETVPGVLDKWIEIPHKLVNAPQNYISNVKYGTHGLFSKSLTRGKWYELDYRMLHSNFDALVDFVEIELAHQRLYDNESKAKHGIKWYHTAPLFKLFVNDRFPAAGIDYLQWEMSLTEDGGGLPTQQAIKANEIMTLYVWWTVIRKQRAENGGASKISGFDAFVNDMTKKYSATPFFGHSRKYMTAQERDKYEELQTTTFNLEREWDEEENEMLIRLIKIRRMLWT